MLRQLEEREINQVLGQNFKIWSPGLTPARYLHYQWWQLQDPWGRRNLKYWGYTGNGSSGPSRMLASCKLYNLNYQSKGRVFQAAGVGAVFVQEQDRGQSAGQKLLKELAQYCQEAQYDFMILNSDIDPDYYARLGFHLIDPAAFRIAVDDSWLNYAIDELGKHCDPSMVERFAVRPVSLKDVEEMVRHHQRWLASQPYGMRRSDDYMEFKLGRELYLKEHSSLGWPQMDIISVNEGQPLGGYALIEQAGTYLRILEVIAPESIRHALWRQILRLAKLRGIKMIRGWAKCAPPLKGVEYHMRDWSIPMIKPLNSEAADLGGRLKDKRAKAENVRQTGTQGVLAWTKIRPPCLLELDHF